MYGRGKCRCDLCKAAAARAQREYVAKRALEGRPVRRAPSKNKGNRYGISKAARLAIYERDEWTCQLCGNPVDREGHWNALLAPTLDHIEPQSLAPIPDHRPSNLRTAHRICNAARGNRMEVAAC